MQEEQIKSITVQIEEVNKKIKQVELRKHCQLLLRAGRGWIFAKYEQKLKPLEEEKVRLIGLLNYLQK